MSKKRLWLQFWDLFYYTINNWPWFLARKLRGITEEKSKILGVLKPNNFDEAIFVINDLTRTKKELRRVMGNQSTSADFVTKVHHGLGQDIRNEWELWVKGSNLFTDMEMKFNLFHADDMSSVILHTAWQRFMGLPETPYIFAMGYIFYWQDSKKRGEWDGQANGKTIDLNLSFNMRSNVSKEKKNLEQCQKL